MTVTSRNHTRTSHRWRVLPGGIDVLNTAQIFAADNSLGIPSLPHVALSQIPQWLVPYRTRLYTRKPLDDGAVHFFLDDYRFESVWARPRKALTALKRYRTVLTPDFSLYRDWPQTLQQYNVYRNRWCGAFWASQGFTTIPTLSWSDAGSYDFCFLGVPRRSVAAISTVGVAFHKPLERQLFLDGFAEMGRRLKPSRVLCYGRIPDECHKQADIIVYPTRWEGIRRAREKGAGHGRQRQA